MVHRPAHPVVVTPSPLGQSTRTYDWAAGQRLAVGADNVQSAAIEALEIMMCASARCFVTVHATNPVASSGAGSIPLEAGEKLHVQIPRGGKVGVIRDSGDGFLHILPVAA